MCVVCEKLHDTTDDEVELFTREVCGLIKPFRESFLEELERLGSKRLDKADALFRATLFDVAVSYMLKAGADHLELAFRVHRIADMTLAETDPAKKPTTPVRQESN